MHRNNKKPLKGWIKQALDFGPLLAFGIVYWKAGLMPAIAVLVGGTVLALLITYAVERRVAALPLFSAIAVTLFGGLSLWLKDETFIKMKPTVLFAIFAMVIWIGLLLRRNPLKFVMGQALPLTEAGWKILALRYGIFFASIAVLNEIVWRNFDTDSWVAFKVFGILGLTILFALSQVPLMMKHAAQGNE